MKSDAQRIGAYLAKTTPATVSLKVAAMLETMKTGFSSGTTELVDVETQIQGQLNDSAVATIQYPFYLNFGRELQRRRRIGVDGPALLAFAKALKLKYEALGLTEGVLDDIALNVFGLTLP